MATINKNSEGYKAALQSLKEIFGPGDTLYCIVRSVARSGMSRRIDYYAKSEQGEMRWVTPLLVKVGVPDESYASWRKHGDYAGARIDGCGMDMCFESAYRLGHRLFPGGFGIKPHSFSHPSERNGEVLSFDRLGTTIRPTSPENAAALVAEGYKFRGRNGDTSGWDNDPGYAINYRTL